MSGILYFKDVGSSNNFATSHHQFHLTHGNESSHNYKLIAILNLKVITQIEVTTTPEQVQYLLTVDNLSVRLLLQDIQQTVSKRRSLMNKSTVPQS